MVGSWPLFGSRLLRMESISTLFVFELYFQTRSKNTNEGTATIVQIGTS